MHENKSEQWKTFRGAGSPTGGLLVIETATMCRRLAGSAARPARIGPAIRGAAATAPAFTG